MQRDWGMKNQLAGRAGRCAALNVAFLALVFSMGIGNASAETDPTGVVAYVNGESVTSDEVQFFFQHHRSDVYQYFHQTYGVTDFEGFWGNGTCIGEESPLRMLKELTMRGIIQSKVQLQLAVEEGLIRDSSFSTIMNLRKQENHRRKTALQHGNVIYGPREYSESVFFDHLITNLAIRLKERLRGQDYKEIVSQRTSQAEVRILPSYDQIQVDWLSLNLND